MDNEELYNYAMELMMLKILLKYNLIDEIEYSRIELALKKDYKTEYMEVT